MPSILSIDENSQLGCTNFDADGIGPGDKELLRGAAAIDADLELARASYDRQNARLDVAIGVTHAIDNCAAYGNARIWRQLRRVNIGDEIPKPVDMDHFADDPSVAFRGPERVWKSRPFGGRSTQLPQPSAIDERRRGGCI